MIHEKMDLALQFSDNLGEFTINAASLSNEEVLPYTVAYLSFDYVKNSPLFKINYSNNGTYNNQSGELTLNNVNLQEQKGIPFLWCGREQDKKPASTLDLYSENNGNEWVSFPNGNTPN